MAGEEFLGAAEVGIRGVRVAIAGSQEDFGGGNQEDLRLRCVQLDGVGRAIWGRELTWCCTGAHWLGRVLRKKARRKGFRTGGIQSMGGGGRRRSSSDADHVSSQCRPVRPALVGTREQLSSRRNG